MGYAATEKSLFVGNQEYPYDMGPLIMLSTNGSLDCDFEVLIVDGIQGI